MKEPNNELMEENRKESSEQTLKELGSNCLEWNKKKYAIKSMDKLGIDRGVNFIKN